MVGKNWQRCLTSLIPGLISLGTVGLISGLRCLGGLQSFELQTLDAMVRSRVAEPRDDRIVIVGIQEEDLQQLGQAAISDQTLAELLTAIAAQQPRVIGLDLYRNLPIGKGQDQLAQVFANTPNLIGIEKVVGNEKIGAVPGNEILRSQGRLAASDILADPDGRIRRGLLYPALDHDQALPGLGFRLALEYLAAAGIQPDPEDPVLTIQGIAFPAFESQDGGYIHADANGYQLLLNLRHSTEPFVRVSLTQVLKGELVPGLLHDRLVIVGSTAAADGDLFFTSYSNGPQNTGTTMYGVELHANLASQIISAVEMGRAPGIRTVPKWAEWVGLGAIASLGFLLYWQPLQIRRPLLWILGGTGLLVGGSYIVFWWGSWWLPWVPGLLVWLGSTLGLAAYQTRQFKQLSSKDELTQLANRRLFNETLQRSWQQGMRSQRPLSLIICDVDYFKIYNDTYGHPQGDRCLRSVAQALQSVVKRSTDLAARYGGEEFVILLPNTSTDRALELAELVRQRVKELQIEHKGSKVAPVVSLSLGVATMIPNSEQLPSLLVDQADAGLYAAKQAGRDRAMLTPEACDKSNEPSH